MSAQPAPRNAATNLENIKEALSNFSFKFTVDDSFITIPNIKGAKYVFNVYVLIAHNITFIGELPFVVPDDAMFRVLRALDFVNNAIAVGNFETNNKQLVFKVGLALDEPVTVGSAQTSIRLLTFTMERFGPLLSKVIDELIDPEKVVSAASLEGSDVA